MSRMSTAYLLRRSYTTRPVHNLSVMKYWKYYRVNMDAGSKTVGNIRTNRVDTHVNIIILPQCI